MIICNRFVIVTPPKRGSTFVRNAIENAENESGLPLIKIRSSNLIYKVIEKTILGKSGAPIFEVFFQRLWSPKGHKDAHGCVSQIPSSLRHLPVKTIVRDPLDSYVSYYEYEWWKRNPFMSVNKIQEEFPEYPDIDFETYIEFRDKVNKNKILKYADIELKKKVGPETVNFVRQTFYRPKYVLRNIEKVSESESKIRKFLPNNISFMKTENLNEDLYGIMVKNYNPKRMQYLLDENPKNKSKRGKVDKYYNERIRDKVIEKEKFLLKILNKLDLYRIEKSK